MYITFGHPRPRHAIRFLIITTTCVWYVEYIPHAWEKLLIERELFLFRIWLQETSSFYYYISKEISSFSPSQERLINRLSVEGWVARWIDGYEDQASCMTQTAACISFVIQLLCNAFVSTSKFQMFPRAARQLSLLGRFSGLFSSPRPSEWISFFGITRLWMMQLASYERWYFKDPSAPARLGVGMPFFIHVNFIHKPFQREYKASSFVTLWNFERVIKAEDMRLTPSKRLFALFLFSNLRQLCNASGQKCYSPDGNIMALGRPCLPKLDVSPCCGLGWECLANGICHDVKFPPGLGLARGGCTESPWKSGYCPNFCKGKGSEYFLLLYCF